MTSWTGIPSSLGYHRVVQQSAGFHDDYRLLLPTCLFPNSVTCTCLWTFEVIDSKFSTSDFMPTSRSLGNPISARNSLEGAEHLLQGLYASLREPLRSMFKACGSNLFSRCPWNHRPSRSCTVAGKSIAATRVKREWKRWKLRGKLNHRLGLFFWPTPCGDDKIRMVKSQWRSMTKNIQKLKKQIKPIAFFLTHQHSSKTQKPSAWSHQAFDADRSVLPKADRLPVSAPHPVLATMSSMRQANVARFEDQKILKRKIQHLD